jgi:N-acylglucosamine 2-epimerase
MNENKTGNPGAKKTDETIETVRSKFLNLEDSDFSLKNNPGEPDYFKIRERYLHDLFEDFLPFMDKYVIDHELGGFMCNTDRDGTNLDKNKRAWYEGRGIWVYSFLYKHLDSNPEHIKIIQKSADFILKNRPSGTDFWTGSFTREGAPIGGPGDIYGNLFIAEGLQEFSGIKGFERYWDIAKDIVMKCVSVYDSPDYDYKVSYLYDPPPPLKAPRVLGHWMVLLKLGTKMLEKRNDPDIKEIVQRSVDAIMNHHFNPSCNLMNEALNHDLSRAGGDYDQFSYTGHAIETLWMVMYEAVNRRDRDLYNLAKERFKRHIEVAHDDIYGGFFRSLDNIDKSTWKVDKVLWLQEEVLIGTMCVIEHSGDQWAKDWFLSSYKYVIENYPLRKHGFSLWLNQGDRKLTFEPHYNRVENFHHPRHLMLNILSLDKIIYKKGKPSGIFT